MVASKSPASISSSSANTVLHVFPLWSSFKLSKLYEQKNRFCALTYCQQSLNLGSGSCTEISSRSPGFCYFPLRAETKEARFVPAKDLYMTATRTISLTYTEVYNPEKRWYSISLLLSFKLSYLDRGGSGRYERPINSYDKSKLTTDYSFFIFPFEPFTEKSRSCEKKEGS